MIVFLRAKALGLDAMNRRALPKLAFEVARAAKAGEIEASDAADIYAEYYKAAQRLKKLDNGANNVRANVSKLRQIIKCADPALLARVEKIHLKMCRETDTMSLYAGMVAVCRRALTARHKLTDEQIRRLLRR